MIAVMWRRRDMDDREVVPHGWPGRPITQFAGLPCGMPIRTTGPSCSKFWAGKVKLARAASWDR